MLSRKDLLLVITKAVFAKAYEIERDSRLEPLHEDHDRVQQAAEPTDATDRTTGPRFADALVALAGNCLVRLADLSGDDLRDLIAAFPPDPAGQPAAGAVRQTPQP